MKIVEFGEDGKPRQLKQGEVPTARDVAGGSSAITVRSFGDDATSVTAPAGATVGKIKIREFGGDGAEEAPRKAPVADPGPFGAARVPQSAPALRSGRVVRPAR